MVAEDAEAEGVWVDGGGGAGGGGERVEEGEGAGGGAGDGARVVERGGEGEGAVHRTAPKVGLRPVTPQ